MNKEIKRVSIAVVAMFMLLFISTSAVQVFQANELNADERNLRSRYESYSIERGPILVDGNAIVQSVPVNSNYSFQRIYNDPELYAAVTGYFTIEHGTAGIEAEANSYLNATDNSRFLDRIYELITGQPIRGASVVLTLDAELQKIAYDALGDETGAVVAIEPETGKILAMVSKPSYDPNTLTSHKASEIIENYQKLLDDPKNPLYNRAIGGDLYYPGSVYKLVVAAEALESGKYTPDSVFSNPASIKLPGSDTEVYNINGRLCGSGSTVTLKVALAQSCNIQFVEMGLELGADALRHRSEQFGFNQELSIPLQVSPSTFPAELDPAELGMVSFGQDDLRVTPLQIAMISAAIANNGTLRQPYLIDSVMSPSWTELYKANEQILANSISVETAQTLTELMVENVSNGVATEAQIPGTRVAGKTGTADTGFSNSLHLWFTGFAPADNPKIAVSVLIEHSGSTTASSNQRAAPIAREIFEAVLKR